MKVYLVFCCMEYEGWILMKIFSTSKKAWIYRDQQAASCKNDDVSYIVQEEEVV